MNSEYIEISSPSYSKMTGEQRGQLALRTLDSLNAAGCDASSNPGPLPFDELEYWGRAYASETQRLLKRRNERRK